MTDGPRIALVLGGGAARGWAHIGVIRALAEAGVRPHLVCGTSAGALVGAAYASGKLDQLEEWIRSLGNFDMLGLLDSGFAKGGVIHGAKLMATFGQLIASRNIEDLPVEFAAVATDIESGREVWMREGSLTTAVRASIAIPGVFAPVNVDGRWLVDGGLVNPVPVSLARALGADIVIAVNVNERLTTPGVRRYALPRNEDSVGFWDRLRQRWTSDETVVPAGPLPGILGISVDALNIMQNRVMRARLAGDPADVLLSPRVAHVGLFEFNRADEAIDEGAQCVARHVDEIQHLLQL
ncbi:MAG: patatin-like phospholipase RssA [Gammaproteobacteria bacterium]